MLSLLGANHRLPLFHMDKFFILLNETKTFINKFTIEYMINRNLNVDKTFREQVIFFENYQQRTGRPHNFVLVFD